ncbi:thiamine pyrophosphate-dependent enzyme [Afifella sp. IM 167]|uniref:thiamine pyrophosphate-dependent enzyme n=1 Tax=Afifella sp. IM 167 TaxID=2033586 RepID=UPI001CCE7F5C|nr:thiamine pyrophosphate-dependent enzyme [Afifella sp. IM 167]MBZ8135403.1 hypothetical protein [Afifella sp. IM 167]
MQQETSTSAGLMNRFEVTKRIVGMLKAEEAVIGGIGNTNFDLWATGQRPQNFYMLGSMGLAFPIALGVALAQPERNVVALEGDGSLLMQVGCLATIAMVAPTNLKMIVFDNGMYQITGGQKAATGFGADLIAMARGAGLAECAWAADENDLEEKFARALATPGPFLIGVPTDGKKAVATTDRDPPRLRESFMRGIGAK